MTKEQGTFRQSGTYVDSNGNIYFRKSTVASTEIEEKSYTRIGNLACQPYSCDRVATYLPDLPLDNFVYDSSFQGSSIDLRPNDIFPTPAGIYDINGPPDSTSGNSWTSGHGPLTESVFAYDHCVAKSWTFNFDQVAPSAEPPGVSNSDHYKIFVAAIIGESALLGTGPSANIVAQSPNFEIARVSSGPLDYNSQLNRMSVSGTTNNEFQWIIPEEWNGSTDSGINTIGNETILSPVYSENQSSTNKKYNLVIMNIEINPNLETYQYLLGGLFDRWSAVATLTYCNGAVYGFDASGTEYSFKFNNDNRKFVVARNSPTEFSSPATLNTVDTSGIAIGQSNPIAGDAYMSLQGLVFSDSPIDGDELWARMKQNRTDYTPPPECG